MTLHGRTVPSERILQRILATLDVGSETLGQLLDLREAAARERRHGEGERAPVGPPHTLALTGMLRRQQEEGARFDWPWRARRLPVTSELYVPVEARCTPVGDGPAVQQPADELLSAVPPGRTLILTAEAGGGKSTLLRQISASLSARHLRAPGQADDPVPLLVQATALDMKGRTVESALLSAAGIAPLEPGLDALAPCDVRWLVMVDALDEVTDRSEQRALLARLIDFAEARADRVSLVITTRALESGGEAEGLQRLGCETCSLEPFDSGRLDRFAQGFFPEDSKLRAVLTHQWKRLEAAGLHPTPFLVTLTAGLIEADPERSLATHSHVLIEQFRAELRGLRTKRTEQFLRRLDQDHHMAAEALRAVRSLTDTIDVMVGRVAVAHVQEGVSDLSAHVLRLLDDEWGPLRALTVPGWADHVRTALLDTGYFTDDARLRFAHRRFAEHLAAEHLVKTLPAPFNPAETSWRVRVRRALRDHIWFQVLIHYGYRSPAAGRALLTWLQQGNAPWRGLAAQLLAFGVPHDESHIDSFVLSMHTSPRSGLDSWWRLVESLPYNGVRGHLQRIALAEVNELTHRALRRLFRFEPDLVRSRLSHLLTNTRDPIVRSWHALLAAELIPEDPIVAESLSQCLSKDDVSVTTRIDLAGALAMIVPGHETATRLLRTTATKYNRPPGFSKFPDAIEVRYQAATHLAFLRTEKFEEDVDALVAALDAMDIEVDVWLWRLRDLYDLAPGRADSIRTMVRRRMAAYPEGSVVYESFLEDLASGADSWVGHLSPPGLNELPDALRDALRGGREEAELSRLIEDFLTRSTMVARADAVRELHTYVPPVPGLTDELLLRLVRRPDRFATWDRAWLTVDCAAALIIVSDEHLDEAAEVLVQGARYEGAGLIGRAKAPMVLASVDPRYVPVAAEWLGGDQHNPLHTDHLASLGPAHADEAGRLLLPMLASSDTGKRNRAARALSGLGGDIASTAAAVLLDLVEAPEVPDYVRKGAVHALKRMGLIWYGRIANALAQFAGDVHPDKGPFRDDLLGLVDEAVTIRTLRLIAARETAHPAARLDAARRLLDLGKHRTVATACLRALALDGLIAPAHRAVAVDLLGVHDAGAVEECEQHFVAIAADRRQDIVERITAGILEMHTTVSRGAPSDEALGEALASWARHPDTCLLVARVVAGALPHPHGDRTVAHLADRALSVLRPGTLAHFEAIGALMSLGGTYSEQATRRLAEIPEEASQIFPDAFSDVMRACPWQDQQTVLDTLARLPCDPAGRFRILTEILRSPLAWMAEREPWQDLLAITEIRGTAACIGWLAGLFLPADVLPVFEDLAALPEATEEEYACALAALLCHRPSVLTSEQRDVAVEILLALLAGAQPRALTVGKEIVRTLAQCDPPGESSVRQALCDVLLYDVLAEPEPRSHGEDKVWTEADCLTYAELLVEMVPKERLVWIIEQDLEDPYLPPRERAGLMAALAAVQRVRVPFDLRTLS
ncbi:NACHT domain-containing NTPase [Streptomyces sp. NBC_00847]|uniref:NACHT domain-containing protein n=1 Tax=Streptomyces sp. NBC_00847 TaxID=2975850 RepID=UPI00224EC511|nr:NACHT domain-containing protein [Streptomyces sp. NBC_00847]MCX4884751.1 NACHT domain-containing protein [Streptomyces sp. NBC_00847]